jgi:CIC family chloride channel protein
MPAFFGDGYGFIEQLLAPDYKAYLPGAGPWLAVLAVLCVLKCVATCLTLSSGGSGGVIAPSLFLGATAGAVFGALMEKMGVFHVIHPEMYALVGMGAALAAVVHAPLASILICFEVTEDYKVMVPAMLACIVSTGIARMVYRDSIYTLSLRMRGIRMGSTADNSLLRRMNVEQIPLEPASVVHFGDPFQKILDLTTLTGVSNFVVLDANENYVGMIVPEDIRAALIEREAVPLLVVGEMMRRDLPLINCTDDLAKVLDVFSGLDVSHLPVIVKGESNRVIGLLSRLGLMRKYQQSLTEE